jgi:hypothetical protein
MDAASFPRQAGGAVRLLRLTRRILPDALRLPGRSTDHIVGVLLRLPDLVNRAGLHALTPSPDTSRTKSGAV